MSARALAVLGGVVEERSCIVQSDDGLPARLIRRANEDRRQRTCLDAERLRREAYCEVIFRRVCTEPGLRDSDLDGLSSLRGTYDAQAWIPADEDAGRL